MAFIIVLYIKISITHVFFYINSTLFLICFYLLVFFSWCVCCVFMKDMKEALLDQKNLSGIRLSSADVEVVRNDKLRVKPPGSNKKPGPGGGGEKRMHYFALQALSRPEGCVSRSSSCSFCYPSQILLQHEHKWVPLPSLWTFACLACGRRAGDRQATAGRPTGGVGRAAGGGCGPMAGEVG